MGFLGTETLPFVQKPLGGDPQEREGEDFTKNHQICYQN